MYLNTDNTEPVTFKLQRRKNNSIKIHDRNVITTNDTNINLSYNSNPKFQIRTNNSNNLQTSGRNIVTTQVSELNFNTESVKNLKKKLDKISKDSGHQIKLSPPKTGIPEIKSPILIKNNNQQGVKKYSF